MTQSRYRIKWKFLTIRGWERRQQTVSASSEREAVSLISPYSLSMDRITSIEKLGEKND